ncbi:MAG: cation transporter [Clostridia bacterium]|nr:cation transporter [Clostridia bacterium]
MTELILKLFVYNKERTRVQERLRLGTVGGAVGIVVNAILAVAKAAAGVLFGSIALVADAANNITDAASGIITLFGFKLAGKEPDSDHPYGHGRMEYISGLVMAFVVLLLGLSLFKSSFERILNPETLTVSFISIGVMVLGIAGKLWLSVFYKKMQKKTGSATFGAASADSRNDVISTLAVLVSTLVYAFTQLNIDGYTGLLVSIFILISAIGLIRETLDPLLGQPPSTETVQEIYQRALGYEGILGIHDLVVHDYGPGRKFMSFHAEIPAKGDILASHDLIDNVERDFKQEMGIETVIHIDPIVTDDPDVLKLKELVARILQEMGEGLSFHDFRAVVGPSHTNLIFDIVLPSDYKGSDKQLKEKLDAALHSTHPECFTVITFDRSYIDVTI